MAATVANGTTPGISVDFNAHLFLSAKSYDWAAIPAENAFDNDTAVAPDMRGPSLCPTPDRGRGRHEPKEILL